MLGESERQVYSRVYGEKEIMPRSIKAPDWLDEVGKRHFNKLAKKIPDRLDDSNAETFAVMCDHYSMYRREQDTKLKKQLGEAYFRYAIQCGLTPKSAKQVSPKQEENDTIL